KDLVCAVRLPPVMVKGKSHPITLYSIRAIYDSLQGECALALPCHMLNAQGSRIGHGILTGSSLGELGHQLRFSTTMQLTSGDVVIRQLVMPTCDEPLCLTALVISCTTTGHEGCCAYSQTHLTVTDGTAATAFLTPGSCLNATQTWRPKRA